MDGQESLLGHVLRLDTNDLMRKVTCNEQLRRPYQQYKRTGHPRLSLYDDNIDRVYNQFKEGANYETFDWENPVHVDLIKDKANAKIFQL